MMTSEQTPSGSAHGRPSEVRPKATLVLDTESYRNQLREIFQNDKAYRHVNPERRAEVSLVRLAELFTCFGLEVDQVLVASAFVAVTTDQARLPDQRQHLSEPSDATAKNARRIAHNVGRWWEAQQQQWDASAFAGATLRPLRGGTDGTREVGVDVLVAAGVLESVDRYERIATETGAEPGAVIVCSHDSDMYQLFRTSAEVRVVIAGDLSKPEIKAADHLGAPTLSIERDLFVSVDPRLPRAQRLEVTPWFAWSRPEPQRGGAAKRSGATGNCGEAQNSSAEPPKMKKRSAGGSRGYLKIPPAPDVRWAEAVGVANSVVVADPYGMAREAIRSLGIGTEPDVKSLRRLGDRLGLQAEMAIGVVVPDVFQDDQPRRFTDHGDHAVNAEWERRDAELDHIADDFEDDGDDLTQQRRAQFKPISLSHFDHDGRTGGLDTRAQAIKRLSTGLVIMLWESLRSPVESASKPVVLVSDDPDLLFALEQLPGAGIERYRSVLRVGLVETPYRLLTPVTSVSDRRRSGGGLLARVKFWRKSSAARTPSAGGSTVTNTSSVSALRARLLSGDEVADLCHVGDRIHGSALRDALAAAVSAGVRPTFSHYDPETRAAVVSFPVVGTNGSDRNAEMWVFGVERYFNRRIDDIAESELIDAVRRLGAMSISPDPGSTSTAFDLTVVGLAHTTSRR